MSIYNVWVAMWQHLPFDMCSLWNLRSTYTSTQSDQSALSWKNYASLAMQNVPSEDSDQTAQLCPVKILIRLHNCAQWRFWSDCTIAQSALNLHWMWMLKESFLMLRLIYFYVQFDPKWFLLLYCDSHWFFVVKNERSRAKWIIFLKLWIVTPPRMSMLSWKFLP